MRQGAVIEGSATDPGENSKSNATSWNSRLSCPSLMIAALLMVVSFSLLVNRSIAFTAVDELRRFTLQTTLLLFAAIVIHRLLQSGFFRVVTGRLTMRRAVTANEAHAGCTLAMFGGGAVGTGVKAAMLSEWGIDNPCIATSITASSVIPLITQWAMTAFAAAFFLLTGDRSFNNEVAFAAGLALSIGPLLFWAALLTRPRLVARIARRFQPILRGVATLRLCPTRVRELLLRIDTEQSAEAMRVAATPLLGRRGVAAFGLALASNITVGVILVLILHGLAITTDYSVHPLQAVAGLVLARTLGSLSPAPGGIGLLDAGFVASLTGHGVATSSALAALVLFRSATFLVPIVTGAVSILSWQRHRERGARGSYSRDSYTRVG